MKSQATIASAWLRRKVVAREGSIRFISRDGLGRRYSNKEIAEYFRISEDTVRHYLRNIFEKRDVSMRLTLARLAVGVEHISDFVEYVRAMKSPYDESRQRKAGALLPSNSRLLQKSALGIPVRRLRST